LLCQSPSFVTSVSSPSCPRQCWRTSPRRRPTAPARQCQRTQGRDNNLKSQRTNIRTCADERDDAAVCSCRSRKAHEDTGHWHTTRTSQPTSSAGTTPSRSMRYSLKRKPPSCGLRPDRATGAASTTMLLGLMSTSHAPLRCQACTACQCHQSAGQDTRATVQPCRVYVHSETTSPHIHSYQHQLHHHVNHHGRAITNRHTANRVQQRRQARHYDGLHQPRQVPCARRRLERLRDPKHGYDRQLAHTPISLQGSHLRSDSDRGCMRSTRSTDNTIRHRNQLHHHTLST
jgi:hypothetical protein